MQLLWVSGQKKGLDQVLATLGPSKELKVGNSEACFLGTCSLGGDHVGWLGVGPAKEPDFWSFLTTLCNFFNSLGSIIFVPHKRIPVILDSGARNPCQKSPCSPKIASHCAILLLLSQSDNEEDGLGDRFKGKGYNKFFLFLRNSFDATCGNILITSPLYTPLEEHLIFSPTLRSLGHLSESTP